MGIISTSYQDGIPMINDFGSEMENVFVNRTVELAKLHTALKEASKGNTQIVFVEGEAGIGKTSLIDHFVSDIDRNSYNIKRAECKVGVIEPYASLNGLLEDIKLKKNMGSAAPLMGLSPSPRSKTAEELSGDRDRIFSQFLEALKKSSVKKPYIIIIDNMQWIDDSSARALSSLLLHFFGSKILFILSYRSEDIEKKRPVFSLISDMKVNEVTSIISLRRLDFAETKELVSHSLKRNDIPRSFINLIYRETEGNPLFIKELISSLIQEGVLDPTSYTKIETKDIIVPPGIKEVLTRRISKLSTDAKKVLNFAAMIGPRFSFEILSNVTGMNEDRLLDIIDELLEARVIEEDENSEEEVYIFTYMQIKEIVEHSLSKSRKRVLHKKIAEYLEKAGTGPYSIAEHYFKGGVYDKAYLFSVKAAEKSSSSFGFESAIYFYKMALHAAEKVENIPEDEILDIMIKLGTLYMTLGDWDKATEKYKKALKIADEKGMKRAAAEINIQLGSIEKSRASWDNADICFEAAKNLGRELGDMHIEGDAERGLGYVHWRKGEYKDAVMHYSESIKYAKQTNDSGMAGKVFVEMGNVYSDMGNMDKAIEYYKKSIPRLKNIKKYDEIARVLNNLGDGYMKKGDWARAIEYFKRCEDTAASIGDMNLIAWAEFNSAEAYLNSGDVKKARELCEEAMKSLKKMEDRIGIAAVHRVCGMVSLAEGKKLDAIKHLQRSVKLLKEMEAKHLLGMSEMELAHAFKENGDIKHAKKWYEESLEIFNEIGAKAYIEAVKKAIEELGE